MQNTKNHYNTPSVPLSGSLLPPSKQTKSVWTLSPLPTDQTRRTNGVPAHRPENRAHFAGGEETRLHGGNIGDRVRAVDSRPARAAAGSARCRRQGARAFYRQAVRFPCLSEHLGQLPARAR